ncbi:uncharacterized protein LOC110432931 [Sorghum bicolor]|uniref:uncharacterized protein LOC110432931 n=1 Tax=Sorghum bicolor TaxID=4558 RepID=UPI000B425D72|nr:uncharacterized protein LOC110432931 [Sorghum bicolor]|eukprot:XP_021309858.1 uncharacterized protein LOC110432931 [Sorghum bicolor]
MMGENQGIEQVLGKLVELLTAKKDEVSSSSREIVVHAEPVQKIELMPNDVKLEGIKNYLAWSRRALRLLKAKKLEGFVIGESSEPSDKSSPEWSTWDATNSLVAAWMLSSMTPVIANTVDTIVSAKEIWKALEKMYSGVGNVMLMVEIEDRLHDLKQGERSVMEYVAELKSLWADADHYKPIELPHSECVTWVKKWIEEKRVIHFLRGLNPEFEARRSAIFHQPTLPSLDEAIAAISQEEYRLKVMRETATSPSPASLPRPIFAATEMKENRKCFNCGDTGHLSRDCPKPLRPNNGRGRGTRGALRGGRGYGGRGGYRANVVGIEEELSRAAASSVKAEEPKQWKEKVPTSSMKDEEPRQWKDKVESSRDKDQVNYVGDFVNFAYIDEGKEDREESWDCNQA